MLLFNIFRCPTEPAKSPFSSRTCPWTYNLRHRFQHCSASSSSLVDPLDPMFSQVPSWEPSLHASPTPMQRLHGPRGQVHRSRRSCLRPAATTQFLHTCGHTPGSGNRRTGIGTRTGTLPCTRRLPGASVSAKSMLSLTLAPPDTSLSPAVSLPLRSHLTLHLLWLG